MRNFHLTLQVRLPNAFLVSASRRVMFCDACVVTGSEPKWKLIGCVATGSAKADSLELIHLGPTFDLAVPSMDVVGLKDE